MSRPTHSGWADFVGRYGVGDVVTGDVVSVVPFGAFVRVGDGVDALAPLPDWPALPEVGTRIEARIVAIDAERHRIAVHPV